MEKIRNLLSERASLLNGLTENVLPSIVLLITSLRERIERLQMKANESIDPAEEILFEGEVKSAREILKEIEDNQIKAYMSNDAMIINTHGTFESKLILNKEVLQRKMSANMQISQKELNDYNSSCHNYNLFCNIIESI